MQWPFLHWNSSPAHFTSHPFYSKTQDVMYKSPWWLNQTEEAKGGVEWYLIGTISTIVVPIALPAASNAAAVGAGKLAL